MKNVFKFLGVVSLISAPALGFAHGGNGVNGEVDFSAAPGGKPTATAHEVIDEGSAAGKANSKSHSSSEQAPGLPGEAGPKD